MRQNIIKFSSLILTTLIIIIVDMYYSSNAPISSFLQLLNFNSITHILKLGFCGASLAIIGASLKSLYKSKYASATSSGLLSAAFLGEAIFISLSINYFSNLLLDPYITMVFSSLTCLIILTLGLIINSNIKSELKNKFWATNDAKALIIGGLSIIIIKRILIYIPNSTPDNFDLLYNGIKDINLNTSIGELVIMLPILIIGNIIIISLSKVLDKNYTSNRKLLTISNIILIITTSILAGVSVSSIGLIVGIGLIIPNIMQQLFNTNKHIIITTSSFICGFAFIPLVHIINAAKIHPILNTETIPLIIGTFYFIHLMLTDLKTKQESITNN